MLDGIVARGSPVTANRVLAWFRRMCAWAIERGLVEALPCAGIRETSELEAVLRAADALETPYNAFVKVLILTGARRSEVAGMMWREINFDAKLWTLPAARAKNASEHQVPLSDSAVDVLQALPRIADSDFVLSVSARGPIRGFHNIKTRIDDLMPACPPWTLHDLRRTFASGCARLGIAIHVVEAALNHKSGSIRGIAAVYNRYSYDTEKQTHRDGGMGAACRAARERRGSGEWRPGRIGRQAGNPPRNPGSNTRNSGNGATQCTLRSITRGISPTRPPPASLPKRRSRRPIQWTPKKALRREEKTA
jgi:integrase